MADPEALAQRVLDMPDNPTEVETSAALGISNDGDLPLSQVFEEYERIKEFDVRKKAPDQIRKWANPRKRALVDAQPLVLSRLRSGL